MTKLKTVEELMDSFCLEGKITEQHAKEIQHIITQDRQAIREALREGVINLRPNSECIDYVLRDNILDLVDELLGEVTE